MTNAPFATSVPGGIDADECPTCTSGKCGQANLAATILRSGPVRDRLKLQPATVRKTVFSKIGNALQLLQTKRSAIGEGRQPSTFTVRTLSASSVRSDGHNNIPCSG